MLLIHTHAFTYILVRLLRFCMFEVLDKCQCSLQSGWLTNDDALLLTYSRFDLVLPSDCPQVYDFDTLSSTVEADFRDRACEWSCTARLLHTNGHPHMGLCMGSREAPQKVPHSTVHFLGIEKVGFQGSHSTFWNSFRTNYCKSETCNCNVSIIEQCGLSAIVLSFPECLATETIWTQLCKM